MIDGLRPYPEMKPSGLPWLGDVPAHWEIKKLGHVGRFFKGNGGTKEDALPFGIPCVRYGDLYTTHTFFIRSARTFLSVERAREYTQIQYGDVLFAASGETIDEIGKSAVNLIAGEARCGGDTVVLRPNADLLPQFLGYATDCRPAAIQKAMAGRGTTVKHIYPDELKQIRVVLPPLDEQRLIVRFLDWHGAQTLRLVRARKKIIALLNEQKQAIIHRAVTRGLDPNAKLKPSGIPWLGDVPEGWETSKLKRLARLRSGETITAFQIEETGDFPVYGGNGHRGYAARYTHDGDFILIGRQGALCGNIHQATGRFFASEHAIVAYPRAKFETRWLGEILRVMNLNQYSIAAAQPGLSVERIEILGLPVPPVEEQFAIVRSIEEEAAGLNAAISLANRELALIQEFRTRLIADVVTGKLDVRTAAASLPEIVEAERIDDLVEDDELDEAVDDAENEEVAA